MTPTEQLEARRCRPASADFGLCVIVACLAVAVQAADVPSAVTSPKPVVIQPSAATPPPPIPEAVAAQPTAKGAGSAKSGKQSKPVKAAARQKTVKLASKKPKAQARKR